MNMSMHKKPLTELEREGLIAHGLDIGTPSQLSDVFRQGIAFALNNAPTVQRDENVIEIDKRDLFGFARSAIKDALTTDDNMNEAHLWSDATDLTVNLLEKLQIPTVQREGGVSVPIEPTEGMIVAGRAQGRDNELAFRHRDEGAVLIYKAMLQSAPKE